MPHYLLIQSHPEKFPVLIYHFCLLCKCAILSCNCYYFIWCAAIDQEPWGLPRQEEPVTCSGGLEAQFQRWQEDTGWRHCVLHHLHSESLVLSVFLSLSLSHLNTPSLALSLPLSLSLKHSLSLSFADSLSLFLLFLQNKRRCMWLGGGGVLF